jgi:pyruvate/2-oxoglutarate dehydrogenase complex dihydrolipoamide acyltransferase (E2) component
MSQPIPVPQLGVSVTEATVVEWHVQEGDEVVADQLVCEISTDKVDTEVLAPAAGSIGSILVAAGETAAVGAPLAMLAGGGETVRPADATPGADAAEERGEAMPAVEQDTSASGASEAPVSAGTLNTPSLDITTAPARYDHAAQAAATVPNGRPPRWSPVARRIALEHGLEPGTVLGSGRHGRVRKADVLARLADGEADEAQATATLTASDAPAAAPSTATDGALPRGYEDVPHEIVMTSPVRRAIAEHMTRSRHTAAHMTTEVDVDMQPVSAVRAALNRAELAAGRGKVSFLPFVVRAACSALADFPDLNATFEGERLIRWHEVNVGIAVDTDRGLLAPVIRSCETMTVRMIGERIGELAAGARDRTLDADAMRAGTFTVSNPGSVGAVAAPAIINQPQVAILGMPTIVKRPVVVADSSGEDAIAIRPIMRLALTFDHRAVDGAGATRCLVAIKQRLETWDQAAYT